MTDSERKADDAINALLAQIGNAKTADEVASKERELDTMLKRLADAKKRVRKCAREKRRKIAQEKRQKIARPLTQLEQHMMTLAQLDAELTYRQRHTRRDIRTLLDRAPDKVKAKKLITSTKRKAVQAIEEDYIKHDLEPTFTPCTLYDTREFSRACCNVSEMLVKLDNSGRGFRPLPKPRKRPKKDADAHAGANNNDNRPAPMINLVEPRMFECVICTETHDGNTTASIACSKGHECCYGCIKQWATSGRSNAHTCPSCREDMSQRLNGLI